MHYEGSLSRAIAPPITVTTPLIGADDPPPFQTLNPNGLAKTLFVCDHASNAVPDALNKLGLSDKQLNGHIGWDIGADAVTRGLSRYFDAPAVLGGFSRLVVDLNRQLDDVQAIPHTSDGIRIPGNAGLSATQKNDRIDAIFRPYHYAVESMLGRFKRRNIVPALISIHSFTRRINNRNRDWDIGILWDTDPRIPVPLIKSLGRFDNLLVGDNEPYSGRHPADFTIDHHAEAARIPHVSVEIRQDLLQAPKGVEQWVNRLGVILTGILKDEALYAKL